MKPTTEQLRTLATLLAEAQMFEKHTRRRPDALLVTPEFYSTCLIAEFGGVPVAMSERFGLVFDVPMGEE